MVIVSVDNKLRTIFGGLVQFIMIRFRYMITRCDIQVFTKHWAAKKTAKLFVKYSQYVVVCLSPVTFPLVVVCVIVGGGLRLFIVSVRRV